MSYDAEQKRVVYRPVTIEPRENTHSTSGRSILQRMAYCVWSWSLTAK
jgi:hypothetical protein